MTKGNNYWVVLFALVLLAGAVPEVFAQTWTGLGNQIWDQPDSGDFSPAYANGSTATFTGAGSGTVTINAGGVTPGGVIVDSANYTFSGGSIGGTGTLTKAGSGTLTLSSLNSYSGGTVINGGTLIVSADSSLGFSSGSLTLNGATATLRSSALTTTISRDIIIGADGGSFYTAGNYSFNMTGKLTGSGTLTHTAISGAGGRSLTFMAANNDFTGAIMLPNQYATFTVNSLADSTNRIVFNNWTVPTFVLGSGTASPLLFNSRQIEIAGVAGGGATIINNNATAGNTITINTDLIVSATGAQTLTLGGANAGNNTFAGAITNGSSAVISLAKSDGGSWILAGTNTYSGTTTVSGGKLILSNLWSVATGNLAITSGKVRLDYSGTRSVAGLVFGAANQSPGVYNSSNSPAYIEGTGNLITGFPILSVTYNDAESTGGSVPVDWNAYTNGQTVTVMGSGTLYKAKSVFRGWTTQPDGAGIRYSQGSLFVITNNTELYPRWTGEGTVIIVR